MPEVCSIYSGVSFAYHATPPWTSKVWHPLLIYHFFWLPWKVYKIPAFVLLLSFLMETLVNLHLLNLLCHSRFPPCFVVSFSSSSVSLCSSSGISASSGLNLALNWSAWANIGWLFFLVQPCSVLFVEWTSLSLALPPYFFYTKLFPLWQMTWLLGL